MKNLLSCLSVFLMLFLVSVLSNAQVQSLPSDSAYKLAPDDPFAARLDSLDHLRIFNYVQKENKKKAVNKFNFSEDSVPFYSAEIYAARIAKLNSISPFQLDYNDAVKAYIDLYSKRKRQQVAKMLTLTELYFPMFEEKLNKYNLPLELKYVAVIESALNANAKSRAGAMGLWQFMYGTGKMFNLQVNSYVDERSDPLKATEAACQYFAYLYKMYGDWQLVLAAYNSGPGTVNKAIRRSGGKKNYWDLRPFLPLETRSYVPAFIAVNYVMHYTQEHNLYPSGSVIHHQQVDTVKIKRPLSFEQISRLLDIPVEEIQFLNPTYKKNIIPCIEGEFSTLCLSKPMISSFIMNEDALYIPLIENQDIMPDLIIPQETRKTHTVRSGENLSTIANKYKCNVANIRDWNNLKSNSLRAGQKLIIYGAKPTPAATTSKTPVKSPVKTSEKADSGTGSIKYIYYVVQPGDTLWEIASKYNGVSVEDILRINNISNAKNIKAGDKIKVAIEG
ncbi:MAG: LysM peptidoglycan-binding domain-containing protein [Bacteroidetes bacterium]|nr:LysM peptidoglycan-binding domain-containing protein [Bacteroidota bacterium]HET6245397.1 LysM peptidoglycan-binding domain-containing protein [Bacteroidia bacterium]